MCGRFACFASHEAVRQLFPAAEFTAIAPQYNLAPTDPVPVVRQARDGSPRLGLVRWGLVPHWAKDPSIGARMINARAETVDSKPAFRDAFRRRRCLVIASGFYEWARTAAGKVPHFIRRADGCPFAMAGLWERWRDPASGEVLDTCTVITTEANGLVGQLHDRMPVILAPAQFQGWLDREVTDVEALRAWLVPWDDSDFVAHPVGCAVNDPRAEGATLVEAAGRGQ